MSESIIEIALRLATTKIDVLEDKLEGMFQWVNDLQSGMYINCVYCGHRYGPNDEVPASMADVLKEHVERCPEHPMSALRTQLDEAMELLRIATDTCSPGTAGRIVYFLGSLGGEDE